jgi:lysophospholipase L1-like esterase
VVGDSIPFWAGKRAESTGKVNLSIEGKTIAWWGVRELRWASFRHSVQTQVLLSSPPSVIIIHLGGNDLTSLSLINLKKIMESEVSYLHEAFPQATLIWVDILPRRVWRVAHSNKPIEAKCKRINRLGRQIIKFSGKMTLFLQTLTLRQIFFAMMGFISMTSDWSFTFII